MSSNQQFDDVEVQRIAKLAHLELGPAERTQFARQLGDILAYAQQIQELDTTGVPPTSHALTREPVLREDAPGGSLEREAVLSNAPDSSRGLFRVPRVIG